MTMAALLIGYAMAIAIVFFWRPGLSQPIDHELGNGMQKWQMPINWQD
jgi:hypothetical protein